MKVSSESIQVRANIDAVFDFMTEFTHVAAMFQHISHVLPESAGQSSKASLGSKYKQIRSVHGRRYHEKVEVIKFENNANYSIASRNYGVETVYEYTLEPLNKGATQIYLIKTAKGKGLGLLLLPISYHILTSPDHDGHHLHILKEAIEDYYQ